MNNIKRYKEFEINEELTSNQRSILYAPLALLSFGLKKIFNIYPMLNLKWSELKKSSKDSKFDTIFYSGSDNIMKDNIQKVSKKDIPDNTMKISMLLSNWNIYLSDRKSKGGNSSSKERPIIYITKDDLKKGDRYSAYRLRDEEVYPDFKKKENIEDYPIVILTVKFDNYESDLENSDYIKDIFLEVEDEYDISTKISFNRQGDILYINCISVSSIVYDLELIEYLKEASIRTSDFLEGKWNYEININLESPLYYSGSKGRFGEIIDLAKKYSKRYQYDSDYPTWDDRLKILDISDIKSNSFSDLRIRPNDVNTLISDIENCHKRKDKKGPKVTKDDFKIKKINITLKRI